MNEINYVDVVFPVDVRKTSNVLNEMFKLIDFRRKNILTLIPLIKDRPDDYIYCEHHHIVPRAWFKQKN